jgi:hypothetical protein
MSTSTRQRSSTRPSTLDRSHAHRSAGALQIGVCGSVGVVGTRDAPHDVAPITG